MVKVQKMIFFIDCSIFSNFLCSRLPFCCLTANGSGLCVRAGFSAENSERATKLKFTKKCRTGTFDPPDAKPLLAVCAICSAFSMPFLLCISFPLYRFLFPNFCKVSLQNRVVFYLHHSTNFLRCPERILLGQTLTALK